MRHWGVTMGTSAGSFSIQATQHGAREPRRGSEQVGVRSNRTTMTAALRGSCRSALRGVCAVSLGTEALLVGAVPAASALVRAVDALAAAELLLAPAANCWFIGNGDVLEMTKLPLGPSITCPESISLRQVFDPCRLARVCRAH